MTKEWLKNKISVEEAERKHLVEEECLGFEPVPFGFRFKSGWNSKGKSKMMMSSRSSQFLKRHGSTCLDVLENSLYETEKSWRVL